MSTHPATARFLLFPQVHVEDERPAAPKIRRYRLARLDLNSRLAEHSERYEYLKRTYD